MSWTHDTFMINWTNFSEMLKVCRNRLERLLEQQKDIPLFYWQQCNVHLQHLGWNQPLWRTNPPLDTQTVLNMPVACCDKVLYFLEHLLSCKLPSLLQLVISFAFSAPNRCMNVLHLVSLIRDYFIVDK